MVRTCFETSAQMKAALEVGLALSMDAMQRQLSERASACASFEYDFTPLRKFSAQAALEDLQQGRPNGPDVEAARTTSSSDTLQVESREWNPPVETFVKQVLAVSQHCDSGDGRPAQSDGRARKAACDRLLAMWDAKHHAMRHKDARPLPPGVDPGSGDPPPSCQSMRTWSVCQAAGWCCCVGAQPHVPVPRAFGAFVHEYVRKRGGSTRCVSSWARCGPRFHRGC